MIRSMLIVAVAMISTGAPVHAQSHLSAGAGWTSSYGFPSPNERAVRLQRMQRQEELSNGFYDSPPSNDVTHNYNYDHSVGDTVISAAEGAYVTTETRTSEGSGTNTYTVGAVNTSNNNITIDGDENLLDIVSQADSVGCQDGSITMSMNQLMDAVDISAGASGASASATTSSSVSSTEAPCN